MDNIDPPEDTVREQIQNNRTFTEAVHEIAEHYHDSAYKDERIPAIISIFKAEIQKLAPRWSETEVEQLARRLIGDLVSRAEQKASPPEPEPFPVGEGPLPNERYEELPGPLFQLLRQFETETEPFRKVHRLIDAVEWAIKWHTVLALSDLFREEEIPNDIRTMLGCGLRTPSLGLWAHFFREALNALEHTLAPWERWERLRTLEASYNLVKFRNRYGHGATPNDNKCREDIADHLPVLRTLIHSPLFTEVRLVITEEGDSATLLLGPNRRQVGVDVPPKHAVVLVPDFSQDRPEETPFHQRSLLDLWPLCISAPAGRGIHSVTDIPAEEPSFFYFNALKNEAVERLNYEIPQQYRDKDENFDLPLRKWRRTDTSERFRAYLETLTEDFVDRWEERERLRTFATDGCGTLMMFGPPGIGKSALLAQVHRELKAGITLNGTTITKQDGPDSSRPEVIEYFVQSGEYDGPTDFLRHLCKRLDECYDLSGHGRGSEPVKLREQLDARLQAIEDISRKHGSTPDRTLLLVDGLDEAPQLGQYIPMARPWLPVVVSSRKTEEAQLFYRDRSTETRKSMDIGPLSKVGVRAMLQQVVNKYDPDFTASYVEAVAEQSRGNPLYLTLLCEELFTGNLSVGDVEVLPEKVDEIYEEAVHRVTDSYEDALAFDVLVALSLVEEPVSASALADLLDRTDREIKRGIQSVMELLRQEDVTAEDDERYRLFHDTLREWLQNEFPNDKQELNDRIAERCYNWTERSEHGARKYTLQHAAAHLQTTGKVGRLWRLITDEGYRAAQVSTSGQYGATYRAIRKGLDAYVERDGKMPEDDARMCRLALLAGEVSREAQKGVQQAFRWAENGWMGEALQRIEVLDEEKFFLAALRLLWIEADRQANQPKMDRTAKVAQSVVDALEKRIAPGTQAIDWGDFVDGDFLAWWVGKVLRTLPTLDVTGLLLRSSKLREIALPLADQIALGEAQATQAVGNTALRLTRSINSNLRCAEALMGIARALADAGSLERTQPLFEKTLDAVHLIDSSLRRAEALTGIAQALRDAGPFEKTRPLFEKALDAAHSISDEGRRAWAVTGIIKVLPGQSERTDDAFEKALNAARSIGDKRERTRVVTGIAEALANIGQHEGAHEAFKYALDAVESISEEKRRAHAFTDMAKGLASAEYRKPVTTAFEQALGAACSIDDDWRRAEVVIDIAQALAEAGSFERTQPLFEKTLDAVHLIDSSLRRAEALTGIAQALRDAGPFEKTRPLFEKALDAAHSISDEGRRAWAVTGIIKVLPGQSERTDDAFEKALNAARSIGDKRERTRVVTGIAEAFASVGKHQRACATFEKVFSVGPTEGEFSERQSRALVSIVKTLPSAVQFDQALDATHAIDDKRRRVQGISGVAEVLADLGQYERANAVFKKALEVARLVNDEESRTESLADVTVALADVLPFEYAQALFEDGLEVARSISDRRYRTRALTKIAEALADAEEYTRAKVTFKEALDTACAIDDERRHALALADIPKGLADAGSFGHMESVYGQAVRETWSIDDEEYRAQILGKFAKALAEVGSFQYTQSLFEQVLDAARFIHISRHRIQSLTEIAKALSRTRKHDLAATVFEEALDAACSIGDEKHRAYVLTHITEDLARAGPFEHVQALFKETLEAARSIESERHRADLLVEIAEATSNKGAFEDTRSLFEQILNAARFIHNDWYRGGALTGTAKALLGAGSFEHTKPLFEEALSAARSIDGERNRCEVLMDIAEFIEDNDLLRHTQFLFKKAIDKAWSTDRQFFGGRAHALASIATVLLDGDRDEPKRALEQTLDAVSEHIDGERGRAVALERVSYSFSRVTKALASAGKKDRAGLALSQALESAHTIRNLHIRASTLREIAINEAEAGRATVFAAHLPDIELTRNTWSEMLTGWREALLNHTDVPGPLLRRSLTLNPFEPETTLEGVFAIVQAHTREKSVEYVHAIADTCPELRLSKVVYPTLSKIERDPEWLPEPLQTRYNTYVDLHHDGVLSDEDFELKVQELFKEAEELGSEESPGDQ